MTFILKIAYLLSILVGLYILIWLFAYVNMIFNYGEFILFGTENEMIISDNYRYLGYYAFLVSSFSGYLLIGVIVSGLFKYGKSFLVLIK